LGLYEIGEIKGKCGIRGEDGKNNAIILGD